MKEGLFRRRGDAVASVSREDLQRRGDALANAVRIGGDRLPAQLVAQVDQLEQHVAQRTGIAGTRTVAALAGATGSGKSSIFNALVTEPVSRIGARRPTTSVATAATWGEEPVGDLLDWLKVGGRHQVPSSAHRAGDLDGLVLLDLPDFDSHVEAHRREADRVIELADVLIWVTDPQKYADAVMHEGYLSRMAAHAPVSIVVLNQTDRLRRDAVQQCEDDLKRLLARDGLGKVTVLTTSAVRGDGMAELTTALAEVVQRRNAAEQRLMGDVRSTARSLREEVADHEASLGAKRTDELVDALCRAAAVPVVVDAVDRDYRLQASQHGGWPFTRWMNKLRSAPLSRLGLDKVASSLSRSEAQRALGRSSLPPASPAAQASVDLATRQIGQEASEGLPMRWADAVHAAATPGGDDLHDALDQAVLSAPLRDRDPAWWTVLSALQWLFAAVAIAGLGWLLVLAGLGAAQIHVSVPNWWFVPAPVLLLVVGLLAGLLLAVLSRWMARRGAARRAKAVQRRMRRAIADVAQQQVIAPVQQVLADHKATREALEVAGA